MADTADDSSPYPHLRELRVCGASTRDGAVHGSCAEYGAGIAAVAVNGATPRRGATRSPPVPIQARFPVASNGMHGRFQPGDHLHVQRPSLYFHHGIYVSDDRVIQFDSGVNLVNKRGLGINAVSLQNFEQSGTARVVRHGYETWFSGCHPPADESWKIVERAEFLLKLQPHLPYNLVGHNCEIIANMCVSGGWTESYQARKFFLVRTMMDAALLFWLASRRRAKLPIPRWVSPMMVVGPLASIGVFTYDDQIRRFWNKIRYDWRAYERMLAQDPRNGQTA